jgi:hypothetical protein
MFAAGFPELEAGPESLLAELGRTAAAPFFLGVLLALFGRGEYSSSSF